jgi:hypothetical protein
MSRIASRQLSISMPRTKLPNTYLGPGRALTLPGLSFETLYLASPVSSKQEAPAPWRRLLFARHKYEFLLAFIGTTVVRRRCALHHHVNWRHQSHEQRRRLSAYCRRNRRMRAEGRHGSREAPTPAAGGDVARSRRTQRPKDRPNPAADCRSSAGPKDARKQYTRRILVNVARAAFLGRKLLGVNRSAVLGSQKRPPRSFQGGPFAVAATFQDHTAKLLDRDQSRFRSTLSQRRKLPLTPSTKLPPDTAENRGANLPNNNI